MRLNEQLLDQCDEFFDLIMNEENNIKLDRAMDSMREFLEKDVDGWTSYSEEALARAVQCRLMEVWGLISKPEKLANTELKEYYDEIIYSLESQSGFETDEDNEYGEGLFDLDGREESFMDTQDHLYWEDEP